MQAPAGNGVHERFQNRRAEGVQTERTLVTTASNVVKNKQHQIARDGLPWSEFDSTSLWLREIGLIATQVGSCNVGQNIVGTNLHIGNGIQPGAGTQRNVERILVKTSRGTIENKQGLGSIDALPRIETGTSPQALGKIGGVAGKVTSSD